jgi:hypothetical protein
MALPKIIEEAAFFRSGGKCECHRETCGHPLPHGAPITRHEARFRYRITGEGKEDSKQLDNCQVLCSFCFRAAGSLPGPDRLDQNLAPKDLPN